MVCGICIEKQSDGGITVDILVEQCEYEMRDRIEKTGEKNISNVRRNVKRIHQAQ